MMVQINPKPYVLMNLLLNYEILQFSKYMYVNQGPINACCYLYIDVLQFSTTEAAEDPNIRMEGIIYPPS